MAWLYVPGLADSNSESAPPVPPIEPSVTWRGKPIQSRSWKRVCGTVFSTRLLFGLTCERSTVARGVASWISSLRASRVSPSALPASARPKTTRDTSGPPSPGSSTKPVQLSFSWRTSPSEPTLNPSETFETWASRCRTPARVPPPSWVQAILDAASSYLPTATTSGSHNSESNRVRRNLKRELLPTATATDWKESMGSRMRSRAKGGSRFLGRLLATPTIKSEHSHPETNWNGERGRSGAGLRTQLGGRVNPRWKEWFMGFPMGWTETEPLETPSSPPRLPSPSDT